MALLLQSPIPFFGPDPFSFDTRDQFSIRLGRRFDITRLLQ